MSRVNFLRFTNQRNGGNAPWSENQNTIQVIGDQVFILQNLQH